jgi:CMP-N-acetylneuraminic acid synthetase/SAM-dependent methyltransferase
MNKVIAILPLRSGSKRIKDKNIRVVGYHPLFVHIIQTCLSVSEIDQIVVSTDSLDYEMLVNKYFGDESRVVVSERPKNIAGDSIKTEDAMRHVLDSLNCINEYKYIILVQATTPLTQASDIKKAIYKITNNQYKSVFSVAESKRFYLSDMSQLVDRPMTQDKVPELYETGCFWIMEIDAFLECNNRIIEPSGYIKIKEKYTLDIDDAYEMDLADKILSEKIREKENKYYIKRDMQILNNSEYYADNKDPDGNIRNILYEKEARIEFAQDEIKFINSYIKDKEILDRPKLLSIGLGGGYAEEIISDRYIKYGVEPDKTASVIAGENVDYIYNDYFENIEFKDDFFDIVFAHHVIEHVVNPIEFIEKIRRILKIGGKLVLGTPNFDSAAARRYGKFFRLLNDRTHISLFSDHGLRDLLNDKGFVVDQVDYPYFNTKFFSENNLLRMLNADTISPPFYGSIMTFYATKK